MNAIAMTASATNSLICGPTTCTPRISSVVGFAITLMRPQGTRATVSHERKCTAPICSARVFELLLGATYPGDFRAGVDDVGDRVEIDMTAMACNALDHSDTFFLCHVR